MMMCAVEGAGSEDEDLGLVVEAARPAPSVAQVLARLDDELVENRLFLLSCLFPPTVFAAALSLIENEKMQFYSCLRSPRPEAEQERKEQQEHTSEMPQAEVVPVPMDVEVEAPSPAPARQVGAARPNERPMAGFLATTENGCPVFLNVQYCGECHSSSVWCKHLVAAALAAKVPEIAVPCARAVSARGYADVLSHAQKCVAKVQAS